MTLNQMVAAVGALFPASQYQRDYSIVVTADVAALGTWNVSIGTQPTEEQLVASLTSVELQDAKMLQAMMIEASYQNATFATPVAYMGTTFWTDTSSQALLTGALVALNPAGAVPSGFAWWDATNTPVPMTLAQLQGLASAILTMVNTNFVKRKTLKDQIEAAATVAAVQAIIWS